MRTITMQTFISEDSILYTVWDGDPSGGDFSDAREVWRREVPLMQTAAYRAGGYHATEAAREQERIAMELANKPEEPTRIATVDFDDAEYIGNEDDGVYIQAAEGPDGWYVSTVVDCNTRSFIEPLVTDDGPYPTEADAMAAGRNGAKDWCINNDVNYEEGEGE